MEEMIHPSMTQFGLAGVVIGALFWLIYQLLTSHRDERREWREMSLQLSQEMMTCKRETTQVLRELSSAMHEANNRNRMGDR